MRFPRWSRDWMVRRVDRVAYYDDSGRWMGEESWVFGNFWAVGDTFVRDYLGYEVLDVTLIGRVQHARLRCPRRVIG